MMKESNLPQERHNTESGRSDEAVMYDMPMQDLFDSIAQVAS